MRPTNADLSALRYAGHLGHKFAVVRDYDGRCIVAGEFNSEATARLCVKDVGGRVYSRHGKQWKLLPSSTAKAVQQ